MSGLYEQPSGAAGAEAAELAADLEHDLGNLVHRLYYWCEVLEAAAGGAGEAGEAAAEMRTNLGELHRLAGRAAELLRPVEVRGFRVELGDVVDRIFHRFATDAVGARAVLAEVCEREVTVDPMPLDRALEMLAESLGMEPQPGVFRVEVESAFAGDCEVVRVAITRVTNPAVGGAQAGSADARIASSVAARILAAFGWSVDPFNRADGPDFSIAIPV